jgi:N-acetylated-alpha-linked acidic dipeptidase
MKIRTAWAALALILTLTSPLLLRSAVDQSLRGFDLDSQADELKWERQASAIPEAARIGEFIRRRSRQPHLAGTPQSKETAEAILAQLKEYGLDAYIEPFEALLPTPKIRILEMTEPTRRRLPLEEPPIAGDASTSGPGMIPSYNAYSGDGDVTAPLIYVNYGLPSDYDTLRELGISVQGKIVIARYGKSFRGTKPKVAAEHGAVGCIIYSDPRDDGFYQGDVYPKGAYRPASGVQRGSLLDLTLYSGDPLSPGWASEPGSKRLSIAEATTMMKIPVLPISYGDAEPLLAGMEGPVVPEAWRGGLPITYHLGSLAKGTKVHLKIEMDNSTHPLYDVIARIPGSEFPNQWIMDGNHHDAWVYGASDPLSGAAPLMETARTLAELVRKGWKPKRTIMLAFWDGEEFGLIGSTEWMEKHAEELNQKLVVYLNSDSSGKGRLSIGGSHTLEAFMQEVTRDVNDPLSGRPLLNTLESSGGEFRISALGSGSDYTPFLQHLGVATLDIRFSGNDEGVYHSNYDDYNWYTHFSDSTFVYGQTLSRVHSITLLRLADSPVLPFEFGRFAWTISRYLDEIERLPNQPRGAYLPALRKQILLMHRTAGALNEAYLRATASPDSVTKANLAIVNDLLYRTERGFTTDPGLPGRPWFRHRIYAPGLYTGYDAKTLPGIREAIEAGKADEAVEQAGEMNEILQRLNDQIVHAQHLLEGM